MSKSSAYFSVDKLDGNQDIKELKKEIDTLKGVLSVSINDLENKIAVDYDTTGVDEQRIQNKIKKLGYSINDSYIDNHIM